MSYTIAYHFNDGQVTGIRKDENTFIPLDPLNIDFRDFLAWNSKQVLPLDWKTPIVIPILPQPLTADARLSKLIDLLLSNNILTKEDIDKVNNDLVP